MRTQGLETPRKARVEGGKGEGLTAGQKVLSDYKCLTNVISDIVISFGFEL